MLKKITYTAVFLAFFVSVMANDAKIFPEIPGWKMKINDRVYNSGDLWELIDGAADIFLSYYFEDLHIAEYTRKDQMVRVELYRHKTQNDSYGIYSAERMPDYAQVNIGSQGYKSQGVLNFLKGNYYVKIMSAGVAETDDQTIALIAEKVNQILSEPSGLPQQLTYFPAEGQIPLSDAYIAQNFMGYSFFNHAFTVKYDKPSDFQLFIIKLTPEEIQKMVNQYIQLMKEDKVQNKDGILVVNDLFNGTVYLKPNKDYLIGVLNTTNDELAKTYIDKAEANIK